jgi:hypothetical protein
VTDVIHDSGGNHLFHCPGCECAHGPDGGWTFNGDMARPTFSPSILVRTETSRCHSFVKDGQIEFLPDCTHALAGKTVPLPTWDGFDPEGGSR